MLEFALKINLNLFASSSEIYNPKTPQSEDYEGSLNTTSISLL